MQTCEQAFHFWRSKAAAEETVISPVFPLLSPSRLLARIARATSRDPPKLESLLTRQAWADV